MATNFLWITNTPENIRFYSDSAPKSNLSLHFASAIDGSTKNIFAISFATCERSFSSL